MYCHIVQRNRSISYQNQFINAIKKYLEVTLGNRYNILGIERPRKKYTLPAVLSRGEVKVLLDKTTNWKHRAILSLIYSAGLRRSELLHLRLSDVDSKRMVLHIRSGKGNKDRIVGLSPRVLDLLRKYYLIYRPSHYLFEGQKGGKYSDGSVGKIFQQAKNRAGIKIPGGVHILRHSFATHLHERGYDIRIIQELLEHKSSKTTEIYTHISTSSIRKVISPLDEL
jgi:site-specific recombinase XerD